MTPQEVNKLYCRYEARLGTSMTKTLGNAFMNLYVMGVSKYFNVINPPKLLEDLKEDPFGNYALTSVCCELYYKYETNWLYLQQQRQSILILTNIKMPYKK